MKSDPKILDLDAAEAVKPATALPWKWDGAERGYVGECSHLGDTGIALDSVYEGSPEDCAYVAAACNDRPLLLAEIRRLRGLGTPSAPAATLDSLTPSQRRVFDLVVAGKRNREIAAQLGISTKTVDAHRSAIHRRLGTHDAASLVRLAHRLAAEVQ